jgi:hypothetical protein
MSLRTTSAIIFILLLVSCGRSAVLDIDEVLGEWIKPDNSLPPVNLVLAKDDGRVVARLRFSGVEVNGTATLLDKDLPVLSCLVAQI